MKNIFELNSEIEKLTNPQIDYDYSHENILINGNWVSEIDIKYFNVIENNIKEKMHLIPELEDLKSYEILNIIYQDTLQKYNKLIKVDFFDINDLNDFIKSASSTSQFATKKPKYSSDHIPYHDTDLYETILGTLTKIYNLNDYETYLSGNSLYDTKELIELDIIEKFQLANVLEKEDSIATLKINECYNYAWFSIFLRDNLACLGQIAKYLDSILKYTQKLNSHIEKQLNYEDLAELDPTNIKLEFKINKLAIAMFYRNLHDMGIINVDNKNQKTPYTNLKKYINDANIYYLDNNNVNKVDKINKEFSKILNDKLKEYEQQELNLLDLLITKFQEKKEQILSQ